MSQVRRGRSSQPPASIDEISARIHGLLDRAGLSVDERIQLLAAAMVVEALRPHWRASRSAAEAHAALRRGDPELADCIEALAPMLHGRIEARAEARAAVAAVEELLGVE